MAKQTINLGNSINDGTGDVLRVGAQKINANFTELYDLLGSGTGTIQIVSSITAGQGLIASSASGQVTVTAQTASTTDVGVIKVGNGLSVDSDGVLSAVTYTLPRAASNILGGIKVGNNLTIDNEGTLSAISQTYTLPTASISTLGGVKIGSGLAIDNGILSVVTSDIASALVSGAVTVQLEDDGDVTGRLKATGPLIVLAGGQDTNDNYVQLQWTRDRDNPDLVKSNYLWLDTNGISFSTTNPVETEFLPLYSNTLFYNTQGTLTFNDAGQVGPVQVSNGIDLYATSDMAWAQLNYDNKNYVWVTPTEVNVDVLSLDGLTNSSWKFNNDGNLILPLGGGILDAGGNSLISPTTITNGEFEVSLGNAGALTIPGVVSALSTLTLESSIDVSVVAGTDLRLFADGLFALRNYSADDSIAIITNYNNPGQRSWLFNTNGTITLPYSVTPASAKGLPGDTQGMFAMDSQYIYYCTADYTNGISNIWNRTLQTPWE